MAEIGYYLGLNYGYLVLFTELMALHVDFRSWLAIFACIGVVGI